MKELTDRQQQLLKAIVDYKNVHGWPPTIREIGAVMGISSLRGVTCHLEFIERKGYIKRGRGARQIAILKLPDTHAVN